VRDVVEARTGRRPGGPIRLLTHLRYAGYGMNPVSFHYCFEANGRDLAAIVADVTNTPWKDRHTYVLPVEQPARRLRFSSPKEFHVSPFHPMELVYRWSFLVPGDSLVVRIAAEDAGDGPLFDAVLALRRREITTASLARALVRHPFMTARVTAGIYWQAFRLHRKGAPYHPHPRDHAGSLEIAA
jgi:DUF1365 family protein